MDGVSVVICCYNSEERIERVLQHLAEQKADQNVSWEVVVVDNASTDNTAEAARKSWTREDIMLKVVHESNPGLSNARNKGLNESSCSIVSFIDDDNWVEDRWVQKVYDWFTGNKRIGLLGGRGEAVFEEVRPAWFGNAERGFAAGPQAKSTGKQYKTLYGAGLSIRKSVWEHLKSNGFEFILSGRKGKSITSGEDSELCFAVRLAGYELYYDEDLKFEHFMPRGRVTWDYLIKLNKSFGKTDPVINIYTSVLHDQSGYKRLIREDRWLVILYSIYQFILCWPGYFRILFTNREGKLEHKEFIRNKYRMLESIRLFPYFPEMVVRVRNAKWRKNEINLLGNE